MQTFLPLPSFRRSAKCLDNKRLGKQRVECKQILLCLGISVGAHAPGKRGWQHHPAVLMWRDNVVALTAYSMIMCREWRRRGFNDNLLVEFTAVYQRLRPSIEINSYPSWFGLPALHASHRSNLLRKDAAYYGQFGWVEPNDLPYFWPAQNAEQILS